MKTVRTERVTTSQLVRSGQRSRIAPLRFGVTANTPKRKGEVIESTEIALSGRPFPR